jgi:lipopolysaccharide/colanic/teichoic acid biosynthesis glycosyltransferase
MSSIVSSPMTSNPSNAAIQNDVVMRAAPAGSGSSATNPTGVAAPRANRFLRFATSSLLFVGDVASYLFAYALLAAFLPGGPESAVLERLFAVATVATIVLYASSGLYPGYRLYHHEHMRRRTTASAKVALVAAAGLLLLPEGVRLLPAAMGFLALGLVIQPAILWITRELCRRLGIWGERALVIGGANRAPAIVAHFTKNWQYGIRPETSSGGAREAPRQKGPCIALIADDTGTLVADMASLRRRFAEVILLSDTPNLRITGLRPSDTGGEIGIRVATSGDVTRASLVRRALDLAVAIPAMLVVTPFLLIAAAAIYAIDPGPVLFRHAREGLSGKTVHVLKLRTMYQDAEQRLEALFRENPAIRAEWLAHFKLRHDPRVLPMIGHLLRSTSLDELPQLANVISGDMAIVGPRPFPEYHLMAMDGEFRAKRRSVTPGLTGLWQISERSNADLQLQQNLDEFYIENRSLWFDWHILVSTIPAVFKRNGAY